ncbi:hypothetical protein [Mycoplasmopsis cricetuli]|uniref:hypothetical protein n=1 Tax=Mycoplasmopsis cricetuli TaxID=171283 RepID=UPI00046EB7DE|nr:hypothetical protein [Mycoplasmopsis cricetuli]
MSSIIINLIITLATVIACCVFLLLLFLLLRFYIFKKINFLEEKLILINRKHLDLVNTIKRLKILKDTSAKHNKDYKQLLSLSLRADDQRKIIKNQHQELLNNQKILKIYHFKKNKNNLELQISIFEKIIQEFDDIALNFNSKWNDLESDVSDILNQLTIARKFIKLNQKFLSNTFEHLLEKINIYNENITIIDNTLNNQGKFKEAKNALYILCTKLDIFFEYLKKIKNIEFTLFVHLPEIYDKKIKIASDHDKLEIYQHKNNLYQLQQKWIQYQPQEIENQIKKHYQYFFNEHLKKYHNKQQNEFKNSDFFIIKELVKSLKNIYSFLKNNNEIYSLIEKLNNLIVKIEENYLDDYLNLINQIIFLLKEINFEILKENFKQEKENLSNIAFQEEIEQSVNLYFEIFSSSYIEFINQYHSDYYKVINLRNLYKKYFRKKTSFNKVEKIWNHWIELISWFIEQIILQQEYQKFNQLLFSKINQNDKFNVKQNEVFQLKLNQLLQQKDQYQIFLFLQKQLK